MNLLPIMDPARPSNPNSYLSLTEAANYLAVSIDVLLAWNEHNILKPTITSTGAIAYSKEQLEKFKAIQSSLKTTSHENLPLQSHSIFNKMIDPSEYSQSYNQKYQQNNYAQINNYHFHNSSENQNKEIKASVSLKKATLTFSIFVSILVLVIISQQTKFNPLLHDNDKEIAYDSLSATIKTTNNQTQENTISQNNENNNLNNAFSNTQKTQPSNKKDNRENLVLIESVLGNKNNSESMVNSENEIVTYGQKASLRTDEKDQEYNNNPDALSYVFDTEGNIKVSKNDPSEKELLATALGASGLTQNQKLVKQSSSTAGIVTFAILGLLFIYFLYSSKKQLIPESAHYNNLNLQPISYSTQNDLEWEKILEVNQKTDGSVVIMFHGNEYKVSKPELDSESDKFIERLMQLTNSGTKEIEYDILTDESVALSSPLSKIVTRLGFVGIKRDLFFPRTSKTRVLFRKYLTLDDLFSMNLTIEDLSSQIIQIN